MKILIPTFILLAFVACIKPPGYPDEPVIAFKNLSKNQMRQHSLGVDTFLITFSFTDGDGDLAPSDSLQQISIVDSRDSFAKPNYSIPKIEIQGGGNGISGDISMKVPNPCCIYDPASLIPPCDASSLAPQKWDTLSYFITIRDGAGHVSNRIETAPIILQCKN